MRLADITIQSLKVEIQFAQVLWLEAPDLANTSVLKSFRPFLT